ncbi:PrsW family intramembrane metalloprotease [Haloarchaeobius litoreus]|uniref:PrsW family intramembrane metalloprotease n=1 Tax=Haloarchaeobius litoreus TaxID=755306 RepID=A0ABD6DDD1_9EURY|nr:PrsW family intramembrane metalloprotease [Haloarchaeobius litoreus]
MSPRRDPIERAAERGRDLYEVATWDQRSEFDGIAVAVYEGLRPAARWVVIGIATTITLALFAFGGLATVSNPIVGTFVLLSLVPALLLAGYVYRSDVTTREPLPMLAGTFLLAVVFSTFASIVNTFTSAVFASVNLPTQGFFGGVLFFLFIVGPGEEFVKWLAVRIYAFRRAEFDAVIDGAVYGAVAGLGFATIENAFYITRFVEATGTTVSIVEAGSNIAALRALAGPGHVIYSGIAGFYLGLAKFNRENYGPIVVKGLLLAALFHATYNITVGYVPGIIAVVSPLDGFAASIVYIVAYDTLIGLFLYRKLRNYKRAYRDTGVLEHRNRPNDPELTEFDGPPRP